MLGKLDKSSNSMVIVRQTPEETETKRKHPSLFLNFHLPIQQTVLSYALRHVKARDSQSEYVSKLRIGI